MISRFSKIAFVSIFLLTLLGGQTAVAQDDILDQIEAELKAEEEKKKAAAKASKNEDKYKANYELSIRKGDGYIRAKKFDDAIEAFTEAKKWGPLESYPDDQIALAKQEKGKAEEAEKREKIEAEYKAVITVADGLFNSKKYSLSIPEYLKAKKIDPKMAYPSDQIAEAKKLQAQQEAEKAKAEEAKKVAADFKVAIEEGDAALKDQAYDKAIASYQKAKGLKPSDPIPNARIETAKKTQADAKAKAEQEKNQKEFDAAMSKADGLLAAKSFDEAIIAYKDAQKIKPSDSAPKSKIAEAETLKKQNAEQATKAKYDALVTEADKLLKDSQFEAAKEKYGAASAVLPHETYPKTKIKECEELKVSAAQAELRKQYDLLVKDADGLLESEEFDAAKGKYQEALSLMPHETHPKTMITEADTRKKAKANGEIRAQYDAIVKEADALVKTENFDQAIAKYNEAKRIITTENHPNDMLLEIEKLKKQKASSALAAEYEVELKKGEALLKEEKFDEAVASFEAAHKILPTENKTTELITEAKNLKEQKKQGAVQAEFNAKITEGESLLKSQEFDQAIAKFNEAAIILPTDNKVKSLIEEAKKEKLAKEQAVASEKFNALIKEGDAALDSEDFITARLKYNDALATNKAGKNTVDAKLAALALKEKEKQEQEIAASAAADKQKKFDGLIADANQKTSTGDYTGAMANVSMALALFPDNKEGTALKSELEAKIQEKQAKDEASAAAEKEAKEKSAKEQQINQLIADAKQEASQKNYSIALAKIQNALNIDNTSETALTAKSEIETAQKAFDAEKQLNAETAAAAEKEQKDKEAKITGLLSSGGDALANKDFSTAETAFNEVLSLDPNNAAANAKLAELKNLKEQDALAADQAKKDAANKAEKEELRKQVGDLLTQGNQSLSENNFDAALASFNSALALDPSDSDITSKITEAKSKKLNAENSAKADADAKAAELEAANLAKEKANKEAEIQALITKAEDLELSGKLIDAKVIYNDVLAIDVSNSVAKAKISSIDLKLAKLDQDKQANEAAANALKEKEAETAAAAVLAHQKAAKEQQIQDLLTQADNLSLQKNYSEAKAKYQEVLAIDNTNSVAASKITEIDSKIANQNKEQFAKEAAANALKEKEATAAAAALIAQQKAAKEKQIEDLLAQADNLALQKNYSEAKAKYQEVLAIDNANSVAASKITEIDSKIANQNKEQLAKEAAANALKEKETAAAAAADIAQQKAAKEKQIQGLLTLADNLALQRNYSEAKAKYQEVLTIDNANSLATSKITEIDTKIANQNKEQLAKDAAAKAGREKLAADAAKKEFKQKIASQLAIGDQMVSNKNYADAIEAFRKVIELDPQNSLAKTKISDVTSLIQLEEDKRNKMNAKQRQDQITDYLNEAKSLVATREYQQAKSKYDKVLSLDASNAAAENGLAAIQSQLDGLAAIEARNSSNKDAELKKAKEVDRILDEGFDLFAGGKYDEAIQKFKEGVDLDPTNSEIKQAIHDALEQQNRLRMIMLSKKSNKPRPQPKFETQNIGGNERTDKKKYQNELGNAYPEGVTETEKQEKRKKITTRVVVKEKVGSEYKRISYDWGGTYYFKNGESVGTYIWQYETRNPN